MNRELIKTYIRGLRDMQDEIVKKDQRIMYLDWRELRKIEEEIEYWWRMMINFDYDK